MSPVVTASNPIVTRVIAALIAALFVAGIAGIAIVDEGADNLPLGEPADSDVAQGDDEPDQDFSSRPPNDSPPPTIDVPVPQSGITPGGGTGSGGRPAAGRPSGGGPTTTAKPSSPPTTATPTTLGGGGGGTAAPASAGPASSANDPGTYTVEPNGQGLYRVVPGGTAFPTWSPDGSRIAFAVPVSTPRLMIANSDGNGRVVLAQGPIGAPPAFSPDGGRIAFVLGNGSSWDLHSVAANGSGLRRLTARGDVSGVAWSSTGAIAFVSGGDIWTVAPEGGGERVLIDSDRAYRAVTFSPNGARIAWYAADQVRSANADGSEIRAAADTEGRVLEWNDISWSPDGTRFAFRSGTGGANRVRVVGFDGSGNRVAADQAQAPDWSPGGNRLSIFTAGAARENGDREAHLELADPDRATFRQRVINDAPGVNQSSGPRFSPDGGRILFATGGADRGGAPPPGA